MYIYDIEDQNILVLNKKYQALEEDYKKLKSDFTLLKSSEQMWKNMYEAAVNTSNPELIKKVVDSIKLHDTLTKVQGI